MFPPPLWRRVSSAVILPLTLVTLFGCSSGSPTPSRPPSRSPSAAPERLISALDSYSNSPCDLLDQQDLAAFDITQPPRELSMSWGPACYWLVPTGYQIGFLPYPSAESREGKARQPGTRHITVDGHPVVQTPGQGVCYQNLALSSRASFSVLVIRTGGNASQNECQVASALTELTLAHLAAAPNQ